MRAFKVVIAITGLFIAITGLMEMVLGPAALPGDEHATPSADSNYRFFAASWLAVGVALLTTIKNNSQVIIRAVAATVFAGGLARLISLATAGAPQAMIYGLLTIELVVPPLLVLWHHRLVKAEAVRPLE